MTKCFIKVFDPTWVLRDLQPFPHSMSLHLLVVVTVSAVLFDSFQQSYLKPLPLFPSPFVVCAYLITDMALATFFHLAKSSQSHAKRISRDNLSFEITLGYVLCPVQTGTQGWLCACTYIKKKKLYVLHPAYIWHAHIVGQKLFDHLELQWCPQDSLFPCPCHRHQFLPLPRCHVEHWQHGLPWPPSPVVGCDRLPSSKCPGPPNMRHDPGVPIQFKKTFSSSRSDWTERGVLASRASSCFTHLLFVPQVPYICTFNPFWSISQLCLSLSFPATAEGALATCLWMRLWYIACIYMDSWNCLNPNQRASGSGLADGGVCKAAISWESLARSYRLQNPLSIYLYRYMHSHLYSQTLYAYRCL